MERREKELEERRAHLQEKRRLNTAVQDKVPYIIVAVASWPKIRPRSSKEAGKKICGRTSLQSAVLNICIYLVIRTNPREFSLTHRCGSGMFIPDPRSEFFHPGTRVKKIPDLGSGSASKN